MHAWAVISHYIDYKGDWDIPESLKKGLNALSGLFYVADDQYESLSKARDASLEKAITDVRGRETPVNYDTLKAFLLRKYRNRARSEPSFVSKLVKDVVESDYHSMEAVVADVNKAAKLLKADENKAIKQDASRKNPFYTDVGAVRVSLRLVNPLFAQVSAKNFSLSVEERPQAD